MLANEKDDMLELFEYPAIPGIFPANAGMICILAAIVQKSIRNRAAPDMGALMEAVSGSFSGAGGIKAGIGWPDCAGFGEVWG